MNSQRRRGREESSVPGRVHEAQCAEDFPRFFAPAALIELEREALHRRREAGAQRPSRNGGHEARAGARKRNERVHHYLDKQRHASEGQVEGGGMALLLFRLLLNGGWGLGRRCCIEVRRLRGFHRKMYGVGFGPECMYDACRLR